MKRSLVIILLLLPIFVFGQTVSETKRILMVVSSYGKDGGKSRPGYEFDEFSQAYLIFKENGLQIDVASPKGGNVEADEFNKKKPYNKVVMEDEKAMALLKNTKTTASLKAEDYDAIYIVGGKGAMFDLPFDPSLQDLIAKIYQKKDSVVSAVCHGPAAFVNVQLENGKFLLEEQSVTGFCNDEEDMFGKRWKPEFPFLLEDKLKSRKGKFERTEMMLPHVSISGKLITGQNPYSTIGVAEAIVKSLGKQLVPREQYADERSMNLIKKAVKGDFDWAKNEIAKNKENYDIQLIAVYGYYQLLAAKDDKNKIQNGLNIVDLATPYMFNANLQLERAKGYQKLGNKEQAKILLEELLRKEPNHKEAKTMLAEL
ncbi:MAG: DJ-1/PfpI family protein [Pyrinomonadaceae bacterium]|nr:DJ-1/PfpI family protein [Pyrinomonadaceae bacterium]